MKHVLTILIAAILLAACGSEAATTGPSSDEQTTTAAAQQSQQTTTAVDACVDSAQTYGDEMDPIVQEWDDAVKLAGQTGRGQLAAQIASLQAVKRKADAVTVPDCAAIAHEYLVVSMNATIDGFLAFMAQKPDDEQTAQFTAAAAAMASYKKELTLATSDVQPTPTVVVAVRDIPSEQLPSVLWADGDLGGMSAAPMSPIKQPFAGGLSSAAYSLEADGKIVGAATITAFDTAQLAADAVDAEKAAYTTSTLTRIRDMGDLTYGTIGQEKELLVLARCRVAVRIEVPGKFRTALAAYARKIDDRAKAICLGE